MNPQVHAGLKKAIRFFSKLCKSVTVAFLLFSLTVPAYAADSILPIDPALAPAPTVSLEQAESTTTQETTTPTSTTMDFLSDGPLSMASTAVTSGRSFYLSNSGSDSAEGSETSPFKSLNHAVSQLQAGDTLYIMEGNYNVTQGVAFSTSGTADKHITIQGIGNVMLDATNLHAYTPIFNTAGKSYLDFKNISTNKTRAAVQVNNGSTNILVDGLKASNGHFAVDIQNGSYVTVRNAIAANNRNAFQANGPSHHLTYENIEAYGSQDIYDGYASKYRNGDGFIMNEGTHDVVFRNIIAHNNWDAGIDCKANNVVMDRVTVYSNKNNFKTWGNNIVIQNSVSFAARYLTDDPVAGEGNGLNARMGSVKILNSTFFDNQNNDIQIDNQGGAANVTIENSIFYRNLSSGTMVALVGGNLTERNNLWYGVGRSNPGFTINSSSRWAEPQFVNTNVSDLPPLTNTAPNTRNNQLVKPKIDLRLKSNSPAINAGNNSLNSSLMDLAGNARLFGNTIDLGAYEFGSDPTTPPPTGDTTAPVISGVASSNVTSSGATVNWTTNEASDSQVQYRVQGSTSWTSTNVNASMVTNHSIALSGLVAGTAYEFRVLSKDQAGNLATQGTISNFTTQTGSTNPPTEPPTGTCTTAMCGVVNNQEVSGIVKIQPNLTMNPDIRKVAYYLNGTSSGKEYSAPFTWGGVNGFDTTKLANGTYTLGGAYTTSTGDKGFSVTFIVKNGVVTPPSDTTAPAISAVASANLTASGATINWTTNEASDSQVQYRVKGTTTWQTTAVNTSMVTNHSVALTGLTSGTEYEFQVKSKDAAGNLATQPTVSNFTTQTGSTNSPTEPPTGTCATAMCGVTSGQTVSGTIKIQPNLEMNPDVRKVSYYLNGTSSGKEYSAPFTWGGTGGFDTTKLANGTYTLTGAYTTSTGDKGFSITFTVNNSADPVIPPAVTSTFTVSTSATGTKTALTNGSTLSGTVFLAPNLSQIPNIRKVSYYLNGSQSTKVYEAPYFWGGSGGFDTRSLANGTYTISGAYTTTSGVDIGFSFTFTVAN